LFLYIILKEIFTNIIYMTTLFAGLFKMFAAHVFMFWSTEYFEVVLGIPHLNSLLIYSISMITSPIVGLVFGGYLRDKNVDKSV
jgi:hypothetical protein